MAILFVALVLMISTTWIVVASARSIFLQFEDINPIIAGGDLDDLPALLRGNIPAVTTSMVRELPVVVKPPRMCEMPDDYFDHIDKGLEQPTGYTDRNEYVRKYRARRGFLNEREMRAARVAWLYFETFTQETTGLANAVGNYPSTTMWDTASYIAATVSAYELCIIEKPELDRRLLQLLTTLKVLDLFRGELPNKVYHTKTSAKVDYGNKPGEIGFSGLDLGRMLVWLRIVKNRYPYLGNSVDAILLKWDFRNVISDDGLIFGARINNETNETVYDQEGRLGYEEYAAKGFALWGFKPILAHRAEPFLTASIFGVQVPYDGRDPRIFHSQNYVVTESYLQDGLEFGFDMVHDDTSPDWLSSDGWRAEFADRIYQVQENRWRQTGFMTARSEHNVKGAPYFTYDTIFSDGYPWNTVTPRGDYVPNHAAVSAKAALGMWAIWDTKYTNVLYEAIIELYSPENGMFEGLYERGQGRVAIFTANNNGIILTALLHKVQGKVLTPYTGETEVWYTAFRDQNIRELRHYPDPPQQEDWLPALRHSTQAEEDF
ncbi:MAG: DUF3131 domain-containing protein [Paracoccaceae bacterium]